MLVRYLDQESIEVHVACSIGPRRRPTPVYVRYQEIPDIRLRPSNFGVQIFKSTKLHAAKGLVSTAIAAPITLVGLIRYAREHRIDIVEGSEHPRDALAGGLIARRAGARHLIHLHVKCADWMRPSTLRALRRADGIVGVSRFVADSAVSIGCNPARVHHALSALESETWDYRIDGNAIREEFRIPREALVFATVGDAGGPWKGQELTLQALAKIKERIPTFVTSSSAPWCPVSTPRMEPSCRDCPANSGSATRSSLRGPAQTSQDCSQHATSASCPFSTRGSVLPSSKQRP